MTKQKGLHKGRWLAWDIHTYGRVRMLFIWTGGDGCVEFTRHLSYLEFFMGACSFCQVRKGNMRLVDESLRLR